MGYADLMVDSQTLDRRLVRAKVVRGHRLDPAIAYEVAEPLRESVRIALDEYFQPQSLTRFSFGAAGGLLPGAAAGVVWRGANLITRNLELNAIAYLTPALALIWLRAFSLLGDIAVLELAAGVALIIGANVGLIRGFGFAARIKRSRAARTSRRPRV